MCLRIFAVSAAVAAVITANPAAAADSGTATTIVRYRDLDLTSADGEATLKLRVGPRGKIRLLAGRWPQPAGP